MNDPHRRPHTDSTTPTPATAGSDWWLMFRKFVQRGRTIASFAPSSRFMARSILKGIDFSKTRSVIELGAGTGPITKEILQRAKGTNCRAIIVELDPDLCRRLRRNFPGADIVEADAADLGRLLDERGIDKVDHILSGLPTPSLPPEVRDAILDVSARRLSPDGSFRQLTVMPWVYYKLYRGYFEDVRFRFVPLNLPPGGVYVCRGFSRR